MKTLVIAHAHPDFSVGGGEIAAYNLFKAIAELDPGSSPVFLARTDLASVGHGNITVYKESEFLWRQGIGDWFRLRAENMNSVLEEFSVFLKMVAPDVVFVQHYVHMGVEIFQEIKRAAPDCIIVATLHEYLAICNRNGQFVKNGSKKLCHTESIEACSNCFPEYSPNDFWLRKHYIKSCFEWVDMFVSPSRFLMGRYIDWGIPDDQIVFIENGQPSRHEDAVDDGLPPAGRARFGFFGQVNEYKGVDVLLQALTALEKDIRDRLIVEIHGAKLETQGEWFQDLIKSLREPLISEGCLRWVGAYEPHELPRRMGKVDWVVVPSIWWENSPMVIQEAFVNQKPVICSNIGGMAEKVTDKVNGLHFEVRNPMDLAEVLTRAVTVPNLHETLKKNIPTPPTYRECAIEHLELVRAYQNRKVVRTRVRDGRKPSRAAMK